MEVREFIHVRLHITYNGEIAESYPAQITEVYSIKVVKEATEVPAE